jgi:3-oxoadipate enol-lactonase
MPHVRTTDDVDLHYEIHDYTDPWAKPATLILQHGFGRSGGTWNSVIPYISRFYRVICPDLRGLGRSSVPNDLDNGINADLYVSDVLAIADAVGADTFHMAGESLGGMIGLMAATRNTGRIRTLSLFGAPLYIPKATSEAYAVGHTSWQQALRALGARRWAEATNTIARFPPDLHPGLREWYINQVGDSNVDVLIAMSSFVSSLDLSDCLASIDAPVLGVYASGGSIATRDQEAKMTSRIRRLSLVHIPTPYHMVHLLNPATCATILLHFITRQDGIVCYDA